MKTQLAAEFKNAGVANQPNETDAPSTLFDKKKLVSISFIGNTESN